MMKFLQLVFFTGFAVVASHVAAQSGGTWSAKAGYNQFRPQVKSGDITGVPGAKVDVDKGGAPFGSISYMVTDNISGEFAFGVPPKLDIKGDGIIAQAGKIADTKVWSPILMAQYRFGSASSMFRPYVGVGATYVKFTDVETTPILSALTNPGGSTSASIDSSWGAVAQVGITYSFGERWFLDSSIVPMRLKSTAHLSTGQKVDVKVNPILVNLAVGAHF
jgi:outer membrane protein